MRAFSVTPGQFRSCDTGGGTDSISHIRRPRLLHVNLVYVCFIEPELMPIEVLHF